MGKGRRHPAQARESLGQPVGAPRFDRSEARPSRPPDVPQGAGRPHRALALYRSSVLGAVIIAAYATTIVIAAAHHELWRDEVVPLSIAREMPSFLDVWRMRSEERRVGKECRHGGAA